MRLHVEKPSPSEERGRKLGIELLAIDRRKQTTLVNGSVMKTDVVAKFVAKHNGHRYYLTSMSKSRAGAWRWACRWLGRIQKGELN